MKKIAALVAIVAVAALAAPAMSATNPFMDVPMSLQHTESFRVIPMASTKASSRQHVTRWLQHWPGHSQLSI